MDGDRRRISREKKTVEAMIRIACRGRHGARDELCEGCERLLHYALKRLDRCPFQAGKPTCAECPIHCYRPFERERIQVVMRYAGPRMPLRHPFLTIGHMLDGLRSRLDQFASERAHREEDRRT
ncbi:MAG: nitrous oxide-stimulated promoter family protein [Anaerolineae bacterium]|jgi:hypothetical protein